MLVKIDCVKALPAIHLVDLAQIVIDGMHELASVDNDLVTEREVHAGSRLAIIHARGVLTALELGTLASSIQL